jgi:hypothetical protein
MVTFFLELAKGLSKETEVLFEAVQSFFSGITSSLSERVKRLL